MLMAKVLRNLVRESSLLAPDFPSFKRQESTFIILNLFVLSVLLLIHTLFSSYFGAPPPSLIILLATGFFLNTIELIWVQSAKFLSATGIVSLTWLTIVVNMAIAFGLASLSYRQDTQYFALLVVPILEAAFRFSFGELSCRAHSTAYPARQYAPLLCPASSRVRASAIRFAFRKAVIAGSGSTLIAYENLSRATPVPPLTQLRAPHQRR